MEGRGVWAEAVPDAAADLFRNAVRQRSATAASDRPQFWRYAALVYRGRFHRRDRTRSSHLGEIERFWGYLRHQLRSKGGIRAGRLGLYLAEYSWRYNCRQLTPAEQQADLLKLLRQQPGQVAGMGL